MVEAPAVVQIPDNCRHNRSVVASVHISLLGDGRKRGKGFRAAATGLTGESCYRLTVKRREARQEVGPYSGYL